VKLQEVCVCGGGEGGGWGGCLYMRLKLKLLNCFFYILLISSIFVSVFCIVGAAYRFETA
jgi:hypothetical protein